MNRSFLNSLWLACFVLLALAPMVVRAATLHPEANPPALVTTCNASQLSVKLDRKFEDAAMGGQRGDRFIVTNISKRACAVNGSPGITLLDSRGKWIGSVYKAMVGDEVKLKPGGKATFEIGYHSCRTVAQLSDRDPRKCKYSSKIEIRFADIKGLWTLRYQIDADPEIEQVMDLEKWKADDQ